jgi:hypothetical protein
MKKLFTLFLIIFGISNLTAQKQAIIINHNSIKLEHVPDSYILTAKDNFRIAYQHTSHGSQLPSGMQLISDPLCKFGTGAGQLYFRDYGISGASDLGSPDGTSWATATRNLLNNNTNNINMIMWSWCGQVSSATKEDIESYLSLMTQLENDFPNVTFVYMTGHLDGTGVTGNLNQRNEQIRNYCKANGKVLFDFADIESYDPDGNYYLDKKATDNCDYYDGSTQKNWAEEWCAKNPGKCGDCSCAHSQCLNCQNKGVAFWWMMARIAGWDGLPVDVEEKVIPTGDFLIITPNPVALEANIEFNIENPGQFVSISIHDIYGNTVADFTGISGNSIHFNTSGLSSGFYFARLNSGSRSIVKDFVIAK